MPLNGRIALVTGASRGIGAATAEALAGLGAHVILVARTQGGLEATEAIIHKAGGTATLAPMDVTNVEHIETLAKVVAERWGRLDILLANAGQLGDISPLSHVEPKTFDSVFAANTTAIYGLIRAFDPLLRASDRGRLIALTSSVARHPRAYWGPYAASKAAMEALVLCYGDEVSGISPVRVAIVDPGRTATRMRAQAFPGEAPDSLTTAAIRAQEITGLIVNDFSSGVYHQCRMPPKS